MCIVAARGLANGYPHIMGRMYAAIVKGEPSVVLVRRKGERKRGQVCRRGQWGLVAAALLLSGWATAGGQLTSSDVLLVVNDDSPTSVYVGNLYRQYYPGITDAQVVHLSGLADCGGAGSTPADEIITRSQFDGLIADPIRQHLIANDMVNSTKAIVTTAGMPYRIEDQSYSNIVNPASSQPYSSALLGYVTAASVESELSMLFQIEGSGNPNPAGTGDRIVNPYQGYRSNIDEFDRDILNDSRRTSMNWSYPRLFSGGDPVPIMEGQRSRDTSDFGTHDRVFSAGDIYLTTRLDGPKVQGQSAVFAVHDLLERSRRASTSAYGVNPEQAVAVFDDSPGVGLTSNRIYNIPGGADYIDYVPGTQQPPDTYTPEVRDDYNSGFKQMSGQDPAAGVLNTAAMSSAHGTTVLLDGRTEYRTNQADLEQEHQAVVALASLGKHGDEGSGSDYLTSEGPDGGAVFNMAYGSVFSSVESFSAVTMFADVETGIAAQNKIVDFLSIGGTGAIGHSFEPYSDAVVDTEFLFYNLLADADGDDYADMTFAEAAFTALPYLSWSEVVLGDPLMRIAYGNGGIARSERLVGDVNLDGVVDPCDLGLIGNSLGSTFGDGLYNDLMDLNYDGTIDYHDWWNASTNLGALDELGVGYTHQPEPASVMLLGMGAWVAFRRKIMRRNRLRE